LQTPVILLSDLDIGMNDWMIKDLTWDKDYTPNHGKVLNTKELEEMENFYRYLDKDGDGIPYRTIPGGHPKGSYFTRGSGHNKLGAYTEDAQEYQDLVDRLLVKWETAKDLVPKPIIDFSDSNDYAILSIGSCDDAIREARDTLSEKGLSFNYLRIRAFPFAKEIEDFLKVHEKIFVVEQNRDGQLQKLLSMETGTHMEKLDSIRMYDGIPIYSGNLVKEILNRLRENEAS
jgi:2-oxoglutarate ferredoxin oxidoreductase subunit alpha